MCCLHLTLISTPRRLADGEPQGALGVELKFLRRDCKLSFFRPTYSCQLTFIRMANSLQRNANLTAQCGQGCHFTPAWWWVVHQSPHVSFVKVVCPILTTVSLAYAYNSPENVDLFLCRLARHFKSAYIYMQRKNGRFRQLSIYFYMRGVHNWQGIVIFHVLGKC